MSDISISDNSSMNLVDSRISSCELRSMASIYPHTATTVNEVENDMIRSQPLNMSMTASESTKMKDKMSYQIHQEFYSDVKSASETGKRESNERAARLRQLECIRNEGNSVSI